jgi:hypothetical protein
MRFRRIVRKGLLAILCMTLAACGVTRLGADPQPGPTSELKFSLTNTRGATEDLVMDRFLFDGSPVETKTLQVRTLSPGVHEITGDAAQIGEWEFAIKDLSNYYGFGERSSAQDAAASKPLSVTLPPRPLCAGLLESRLDHVHSILKNKTRNTVGVKGDDTYKPVPFS